MRFDTLSGAALAAASVAVAKEMPKNEAKAAGKPSSSTFTFATPAGILSQCASVDQGGLVLGLSIRRVAAKLTFGLVFFRAL